MKFMLYAKLTTIIGSIYYTPHILSSHIPHFTKISTLTHYQPPSKSYFAVIFWWVISPL